MEPGLGSEDFIIAGNAAPSVVHVYTHYMCKDNQDAMVERGSKADRAQFAGKVC